jgi:hypothetical protein
MISSLSLTPLLYVPGNDLMQQHVHGSQRGLLRFNLIPSASENYNLQHSLHVLFWSTKATYRCGRHRVEGINYLQRLCIKSAMLDRPHGNSPPRGGFMHQRCESVLQAGRRFLRTGSRTTQVL